MEKISSNVFLHKQVTVRTDRKLGEKHPKFDWSYPINYGYIPNVMSGDGEELDAYILGVNEPVETFTGICIAIIKRKNEDDDKLIVVPEGQQDNFSEQDIEQAVHFQEQWFEHELIK